MPENLIRQSATFVLVGCLTTTCCAGLYAMLRQVLPLTAANLLAIALTTVLSSELHRRLTFSGERAVPSRMLVQNLASFAWYATSTSLGLFLLDLLVSDPSVVQETAAMVLMSALGGTARFLALRFWVLRPRRLVLPNPALAAA